MRQNQKTFKRKKKAAAVLTGFLLLVMSQAAFAGIQPGVVRNQTVKTTVKSAPSSEESTETSNTRQIVIQTIFGPIVIVISW